MLRRSSSALNARSHTPSFKRSNNLSNFNSRKIDISFNRSSNIFPLKYSAGIQSQITARYFTTEQQQQQGKIRVKETTGLTGLPVQPRWREILLKLFDELQENAQQKIPEDVFYRQVIDNTVNYWRKIVQEHTDYEDVENILGRGQVEEMILMVQDEMDLLETMAHEQPWIITEEDIKEEEEVKDHFDMATPREYVRPPITIKPGKVKSELLKKSEMFPMELQEKEQTEEVEELVDNSDKK